MKGIEDNKQLDRIMKRAFGAYEMWHQKHPEEVKEVSVDWPDVVYCIGRAEEIIYKSDKWEKKNDFFTYFHVFDTRPYVYCSKKSDLMDFANNRKRSVSRLLNVRDLKNTPVAAPYLAKTVQLTLSLNNGDGTTLHLRNHPALCCTLDKKTLIVCLKDDLLFINGGKMSVTERGIVK